MYVGVGVKRMLETGAHQYAFVSTHDIHRSVTLMHIKINNGNSIKMMKIGRAHGCQGDVVVKTEAHGLGALSMVAGGPCADKCVGYLATHNHVYRLDICTRSKPCCAESIRHHGSIRISEDPTPHWLHHV